MATGLAIPPQANPNGGMALSSGDDQDNNIISIALAADENENFFQQNTGMNDDIVFDINDPLSQAFILQRIRTIFNTFTRLKRFKLLENTIQWTQVDGDMILSFKYLPMETDSEPQTFSTTINSSSNPALVASNNAT